MPKLIVVVGLPGSGKSFYIDELQGGCQGVCADDYMANSHANSCRFTDSRHYANLICDLRNKKDCIISPGEMNW